jgi:hypothetical protein
MNGLALFNELFDIAFLLSLFVLLLLIWLSSRRREKDTHTVNTALIEVARQNAESARIVAEAVRTLAAIVQNEQAKSNAE